MAKAVIPPDWNQKVLARMKEIRSGDPTKDIFGLSFPESWKGELTKFARNGDLGRLFRIRAVTFSGSTIERFDPPSSTA